MPNHVANSMKVTGPSEELLRFKEEAQGEDEALDIGRFVPMPEELRNTSSPNNDKKQAFRLVEAYGFSNWYDWANANWGTKWGVYDSVVEHSQGDDGFLLYRFKTAWAPFLDDVLIVMSTRFPLLRFHNRFAERGAGYYGWRIFEDGSIVSAEVFEEVKATPVDKLGNVLPGNSDDVYDYRYPDLPEDIQFLMDRSG